MKYKFSRQGIYTWIIRGLIMHIFLFFSILSFANISASIGQGLLQRKISLRVENLDIKSVLKVIESSDTVRFAYQSQSMNINRKITLDVENTPLFNVLSMIFDSTYEFDEFGNFIVIKSGQGHSRYQSTVSGTVRDEKTNEVLPGVNVAEKGTTNGTVTDADGKFSLSVEDNAVLVVSSIGYVTLEISVSGRASFEVALAADVKSLEEVVVVGYGTQKKANLTGAVSTVDSKALEGRPVSNLANALQGVASGVIITRGTGQPGEEGIGIQIRGATSANGNVSPLVLVDGVTVPAFTLQTLNPLDINNISILKDAASAAIYGAQAAGGVMLITTKKGKPGKTAFEYSNQNGIDWTLNVPKRMPLIEEALYSNAARRNANVPSLEFSDLDIQRIRDKTPYAINPADTNQYDFYNQNDMISQVMNKYTSMQTHNLSAGGGTEKINYYVSLGYYGKQGVFKVGPDRVDRYNARFNLGTQLTKHFSLDSKIAYTLQSQQAPSVNVDGLIFSLYRSRTRYPIFTPEGRLNGGANASGNNAYAYLKEGGYNNIRRNFFDGVFTFTAANFVKGLTLKGILGKQFRIGERALFKRRIEFWNRFMPNFYLNDPNSYALTNEVTNNTNVQFLAEYDFFFGKNKIHLLTGYQWEDSRYTSLTTTSLSLANNDQPSLNLGDDKSKANAETIYTYAFQSVFGRFNYNYDGKYLFETTLRIDQSSQLAQGARTKFFPSISAGWNLNRENWFYGALPFFSEFKVRGSWGQLGNAQGIGYYDYLNMLSRKADLILGTPESRTPYFYQEVVPSSSLSWETIETSDVGLDMAFLQNKLQVSADYYIKYNRNMLTPLQLPATFGVGTPKINNGELKSWGWETEVKYRDKIGKEFNYTIGFNLSDNQNKLINYAGRKVINAGTVNILEGYPLNSIWGYKTDGYFQTGDEVRAHAVQDSRTGAGDVRYVDQNDDKRITIGKGTPEDHGDLLYLGSDQQRYAFGLNVGFQWKGIDFTAFVQGVGQRTFLPSTESFEPLAQTWKQALAIHSDYWTPENPNAAFPRPYVRGGFRYLPSDKWVLNGQYIRLKNLQLGYSLPENWLKKLTISKARIFVTGQDMLAFTRLGLFNNYLNPESRNGVENDYPFFATLAVGLNLSF